MKVKIVLIISGIALFIFLIIQIYIITNIYSDRSYEFDARYKSVIDESLLELTQKIPNKGMDSVYFYLNITGFHGREIFQDLEGEAQDSARINLVRYIEYLISLKEKISPWIKHNLKQAGLDENIRSGFQIRNLAILDDNRITPLISNDTVLQIVNKPILNTLNTTGLLLDKFVVERNYIRIEFDFFVDIAEKQNIIIKELYGVLFLVSMSILIVALVFFITIRNLMRQKKISDLKSDFINNMTHELKTPLSTISLATQGLSMPEMLEDKEQVKNLAGIITKQNKHLVRLIDQILDVSIWEKKKFVLEKTNVNLTNFLKDRCKVFNIQYPEIAYKEEYPEAECVVSIDEFQFTVVINNLLDNAIKYAEGKLEIEVKLIKTKSEVILYFSDNGIGISTENQEMIFNKFFRVDTPQKHNTKGLGLGLFYVKNIVDAHNGKIDIDSKLGQGTTFIISLACINK